MALEIGTAGADSGMTKAIYDKMDALLSPPLQKAVDDASSDAKPNAQKALDEARNGWKKMSFAIATGVVGHLLSNLEINGIETRGDVNASAAGSTDPAPPGPHMHPVNLSAKQSNVTFRQSNDGTGRVK